MPERRNYLLGFGERLTAQVEIGGGGGPKKPPYSFEEAQRRLQPMLANAASLFDALPEKACPNGEAVASVTLHPEYYAKSYYPSGFLRPAGLRVVGSRARTVRPDKRSRGREPEEAVTTELFVAGSRSSFHRLADQVPRWRQDSAGARQLPAIERVSAFEARHRIRRLTKGRRALPLEVVLHASERPPIASSSRRSRHTFRISVSFRISSASSSPAGSASCACWRPGNRPVKPPVSPSCVSCGRCRGCAPPTRSCAASLRQSGASNCRNEMYSTRICGSRSSMGGCRRRVH